MIMEATSLSEMVNLAILELQNNSNDTVRTPLVNGYSGEISSAQNMPDNHQWLSMPLNSYTNNFNYNPPNTYSDADIYHQPYFSNDCVPISRSEHSILAKSKSSSSNNRRTRSLTSRKSRERG